MRIIEGTSKKSYESIAFNQRGRRIGYKDVHVPYICYYSIDEEKPRVTCHFIEFFPPFNPPYKESENMQNIQILPDTMCIGGGNYAKCLEQISFNLKKPLLQSKSEDELVKYEDKLRKEIETTIPLLLKGKKLWEMFDDEPPISKSDI